MDSEVELGIWLRTVGVEAGTGWGEVYEIGTKDVASGYTGGLRGTQCGTLGATWLSGQRQKGTLGKWSWGHYILQ